MLPPYLHLWQQLLELGVGAQCVAALLSGAARHYLAAVAQLPHALLRPRRQLPERPSQYQRKPHRLPPLPWQEPLPPLPQLGHPREPPLPLNRLVRQTPQLFAPLVPPKA